jgi:toxin ParE1/3/4
MSKPKFKVLIFPLAELDLIETKKYYTEVLKTPSTKVFDRFLEVIDLLEDNPLIYSLASDPHLSEKGYRFVPIENFLVFYVIKGNIVEIRRFLYGSRKYSSIL